MVKGRCLPIPIYDYAGKADLTKGRLPRAIETQKENGDNHAFFKDIKAIFKKRQNAKQCMAFFLKLNPLIISEKCTVTPSFVLGYQKHLLSSAFSA